MVASDFLKRGPARLYILLAKLKPPNLSNMQTVGEAGSGPVAQTLEKRAYETLKGGPVAG